MKKLMIIRNTIVILLLLLSINNAHAQFASSYDLRTYGYVTSVKDQDTCGACWAFASCAAIESSWLKQSYGTFDLSEDNLIDCHNFDPAPCDWGNFYITQALLSLHKGIYTETQDSFTPNLQNCPLSFPFPPTPQAYVEEMKIIPGTVNDIKQALLDYGAVATTMYMNWNDPTSWDAVNNKYYDPLITLADDPYAHCVTIVGWNDAYTFSGAPGNGGWIIKDSYGTSWADNGYFYCSYYDAGILGTNVVFPTKENIPDSKNDCNVYSHDEFGWVDNYGFSNNIAYTLAKYTLTNGTTLLDQQIKRIGTYAVTDSTTIDIELYRTKTGDVLSDLITTTSIDCPVAGFYTAPLTLKTDTFGSEIYIKVKYTGKTGTTQPIPIEKYEAGSSSAFTASNASCWISSGGTTWAQIGQSTAYNFDLCIKMYTEDAPYAEMNVISQTTMLPVTDTVCQMENLNISNSNLATDSLKWYFNDNYSGNMPNFIHQYTTGGDIEIKLIEWYGNNSDTAIQNIYVSELPDIPTITQNENTLESTTANSYQWLYNDFSPIIGEVNQTYDPAVAGFYRIQVSNSNNCSSISDSFEYIPTITSIMELAKSEKVYPNPAKGIITIEFSKKYTGNIQIISLEGIVFKEIFVDTENKKFINVFDLQNGIYILKAEKDQLLIINN